ncbi:cytidylyltransferase domain-containing protein [Orenia marismortui]|uniref:N-acylneuraminate cytidylyltransferase n=1 Tax=Orenia marismortui TaxID=46469 RepID=A0A4R8HFM1_9FIRM|nr:acylneuraminate cytidylyltransferase family protein [Orenia marismortui]TDX58905.1 N-acylneuraminate cytidylyltransferase [Orenia marismortui]
MVDRNRNIVAIIPARGGSKGIPRKNIKLLAGKPLIAYSIEQALASKLVDRVIVSTDDEEIKEVAESYGAEVPFVRPKEFATDEAATEPVLQHAVQYLEQNQDYSIDLVVLLQATSPIRYAEDIDKSIKKLVETQADSLLSVSESHAFFWLEKINGDNQALYDYKNRPRRQDIEEQKYQENGSIYLTKKEILMAENNRLGGKIEKYIMEKLKSFEIDDLEEFWLIEQIIKEFYSDLI